MTADPPSLLGALQETLAPLAPFTLAAGDNGAVGAVAEGPLEGMCGVLACDDVAVAAPALVATKTEAELTVTTTAVAAIASRPIEFLNAVVTRNALHEDWY